MSEACKNASMTERTLHSDCVGAAGKGAAAPEAGAGDKRHDTAQGKAERHSGQCAALADVPVHLQHSSEHACAGQRAWPDASYLFCAQAAPPEALTAEEQDGRVDQMELHGCNLSAGSLSAMLGDKQAC